jgi:isopentenyl-diphosphate delta-isomerase
MAKCMALGASVASAALPFVEPAMKGKAEVEESIMRMLDELKVAMFLCGCGDIKKLHSAPTVITGWTKEYIELRGFDAKEFALRSEKSDFQIV